MLQWEKLTLKLRNPFRVSYGTSEARDAFWLRLANEEGWGEGTIPPYYRVDPSAMTDCWKRAGEQGRPFPDQIDEIAAWIPDGPAPARCALEMALLDRIGKKRGVALHQLLDLPRPSPMPTCFTIGIDEPAAMAEMARTIADYPMIKLKLGTDNDEGRVRAVREARPEARLVVDANSGWTPEQAIENLRWLTKYNLELIEQPLPKEQIEAMGRVQRETAMAIVADESVQTFEDVERLGAAGVKGINLKLMKLGGVLPALRILRRGRELGMKVMLGCMIETSLGITAMAHLAGLADWLDLDAPLLISNDPFDGVTFDRNAMINLPTRAGIGVIRR